MFRPLATAGYLLALACAIPSLAWPQDAAGDAASKVLALERLWGQAAEIRDTKALESIFDDALTYVPIDGRLMTKPQVLADTKLVSPVVIVVESEAARSHADIVVVTGVLRLSGREHGKAYLRRGRFVDTWLFKRGHWVCIASMTTPMNPGDR